MTAVELAKLAGKYKGRTKKYTDKHAGMAHELELYATGGNTVKGISEINANKYFSVIS
ncbi:hypothetical protein [Peribacillus glennii]|uniref:hypothetical protein n=1 Tax=Peribacillus glennii TaxID=2303991 RepID=UPI001F220499|nr:hypothetical protein [Peribacillus glennii]